MKINIAIIDDSIQDKDDILSQLTKCISTNIDFYVEKFDDETICSTEKIFDLYLLDIDMPIRNGIEIAKKINNENKESRIIFVSRREDLVFNTFAVESLYFVRKDFLNSDLKQAMSKYLRYFEKNNRIFEFIENGIKLSVKWIDIYYFEVYRNNMFIVTKTNKYCIRKTMKAVVNEFDDSFVRINESFYVNLNNIRSLENSIVIMKNSQKLQISRRNIKIVNEMYAKFLMIRG